MKIVDKILDIISITFTGTLSIVVGLSIAFLVVISTLHIYNTAGGDIFTWIFWGIMGICLTAAAFLFTIMGVILFLKLRK